MTSTYGECFDEWAIARGDAWEELFRMWLLFETFLCGKCGRKFSLSNPEDVGDSDEVLCGQCRGERRDRRRQ